MSRPNAGIAPGPAAAGPLIRHFDGTVVDADTERWARAYEDVYAQALDLSDHSDPPIAERLSRHARRPGFVLVAALDGEEVAGFAYGYPLPPDTLWWQGLTPRPEPDLTREHLGRTLALCELLVGPERRRSRIGHALFESFLAGRREERVAALVAADNDVMLATCATYGFRPVGRMEPYPGWRPHLMIVRQLDGR